MENLGISELTIKIILLFFPGIICSTILRVLTIQRGKSPFSFFTQSLFLGLFSYLSYWGWLKFLHNISPIRWKCDLIFLKALQDSSIKISYHEIFFVSAFSVLIGIIVVILINYKIHFIIAQKLKISKKFGDHDVWEFVFNSPDVEWVTVRDHKNDLLYDGWVKAFSDASDAPELLLRDVNVYKNISGEFLYDVGVIYLTLSKEDISIEFRDIGFLNH